MAVPVVIWSGCGDDEGGSSACTPNETQSCLCSASVMGVQRCADDGASFEACDCSPAGASGAGGGAGSGSGGSSNAGAGGTGAPQVAPFTGASGLPCEADADCEGDLICIPSTSAENPFGTGGIQGGYCTLPCADGQAGSDTCGAVDSASECLLRIGATEGSCLALCLVNGGDTVRCGGRIDMACVASDIIDDTGEVGLCRPQCTSDVDCGNGRFCDLGTSFCVDTVPTRGPGVIGAACNGASAADDCSSGFCLDTEADGSGFCTAPCVVGPLAGCGFSEAASPREAACFPTSGNALIGDRGVCVELCDVAADCSQASYTCTPLSAQGQDVIGRTGRCLPPADGAGADAGAPDAG